MSKSLELEDGFKKSCADFDQNALELNKQIRATQEELQQHKEKNDGHIAELQGIQERLKNITKKLQETGAEHKDCCGLVGFGGGDEDRDRDGNGNGDADKNIDGKVEGS
ncbi:hypothetical protein BELL_0224g00170 [Botrytis elliptica]|uniref:Uncharacterized protein n=1 Tax=Botrytis elliptica TaxID=278938 RepID=A0A4Z1JP75_9HELO|nr:hypothetical protein EAE99_003855 [Botrytis elliptica]TGO75266.1 hypothetical protein BELL_0224g00170 [Botrytis elliptica]